MLSRLSRSAAWIGGRTRPRRLVPLYRVVVVGLLVSACASPSTAPSSPGLVQPSPPSTSAVAPGVTTVPGLLPFPIEQNIGQTDPRVGYLLRAGAMRVGFGAGELTYVLGASADPAGAGGASWPQNQLAPTASDGPTPSWTVRQELVGASKAMPSGTVGSPTTISYFKGHEEQWLAQVPAFEQVAYTEAWPGITVTYERGAGGPKSAYHVAAGADPGQIRLLYSGARVRVDETGALVAETPLGQLRESPPVAWQEHDGTRAAVEAHYELLSDPNGDETEYGFALGAYDAALPLVIDPQIAYAGFIGGPGVDQSRAVAVDGSGNVYLTGFVDVGATFPAAPATFDPSHNGDWDAYVVKLNPAGTGLVYASFLGGSGTEIGFGIAVDPQGNAYVSGLTSSSEATFPGGSGMGALATFDGSFNGGTGDAFVVKVNAAGTALLYAGYVGGSGHDQASGIRLDAAGNAYISGVTESTEATFPGGSGMGALATFDGSHNGGTGDAFVAKVNAAGTALLYAGYVGGNGYDYAYSIAVDGAGNAYVGGKTESSEATFPNGSGMASLPALPKVDATYNGGVSDAFVAKVKPDGSALLYAGYVGGSGEDIGEGIAIDANGSAYLTGYTTSTEGTFPNGSGMGTLATFDRSFNSTIVPNQSIPQDGFLVKVNAAGTGLMYAGYVGGDAADGGIAVAVDSAGNAFVTGYTTSSEATFPNGNSMSSIPATFDSTYNSEGDGFLVKVNAAGNGLMYAGYIGGNGPQVLDPNGGLQFGIEVGLGVAVDQAGNAYVVGRTLPTSQIPNPPPTTFPDGLGMGSGTNALPTFDASHGGGLTDAFVVKVTPGATCALAGRHASAGVTFANYAYQYAYYDYITSGSARSLNALADQYAAYNSGQAGLAAHTNGDYATAKTHFQNAATYAYYGYQESYLAYSASGSQYAYYAFAYGYYAAAYENQALVSC